MADTEIRQPKSKWYRVIATGEILPALKSPAGYEDDHPKDYEPCAAPTPKTAAPVVPPPAPQS
jgi:hypothetical protein